MSTVGIGLAWVAMAAAAFMALSATSAPARRRGELESDQLGGSDAEGYVDAEGRGTEAVNRKPHTDPRLSYGGQVRAQRSRATRTHGRTPDAYGAWPATARR